MKSVDYYSPALFPPFLGSLNHERGKRGKKITHRRRVHDVAASYRLFFFYRPSVKDGKKRPSRSVPRLSARSSPLKFTSRRLSLEKKRRKGSEGEREVTGSQRP